MGSVSLAGDGNGNPVNVEMLYVYGSSYVDGALILVDEYRGFSTSAVKVQYLMDNHAGSRAWHQDGYHEAKHQYDDNMIVTDTFDDAVWPPA